MIGNFDDPILNVDKLVPRKNYKLKVNYHQNCCYNALVEAKKITLDTIIVDGTIAWVLQKANAFMASLHFVVC